MKKINYSIDINAPVDKVYDVISGKDTAIKWVKVFAADSWYEGEWIDGTSITFCSRTELGLPCGLICHVKISTDKSTIILQPYGVMEDDKEFIEGSKVEGLELTYDKYVMIDQGEKSRLDIEISIVDEQEEFFNKTWPVALALIKKMSE